jgi:hypothetical protein
VELDPQCVGDLIIPLGLQFQITRNLNLAIFVQGAKFFRGCFELEALKVEMAPQRVGDLIVPSRPRFQITKYLYLAILAKGAKLFCRSFEFEVFEGGIGPLMHNSTKTKILNHQTSKFSHFGSIFLAIRKFKV